MDQAHHHHEQLRLQHDIEEALVRAECGDAEPEDWQLIRWACGVCAPRKPVHHPDLFSGEHDGSIRI